LPATYLRPCRSNDVVAGCWEGCGSIAGAWHCLFAMLFKELVLRLLPDVVQHATHNVANG
jgi:hypothetical protein